MALLTKTKHTTAPVMTEVDALDAALAGKQARADELARETETENKRRRDLQARRAALLGGEPADRAAVDACTREIADAEGLCNGLVAALELVRSDITTLEQRRAGAIRRQTLAGLRVVVEGRLAAARKWDEALGPLLHLIEEIDEGERDLAAVASALGLPMNRIPLAELLLWRVWSRLQLPGSTWLSAAQRVSVEDYQTRRLGSLLRTIEQAEREVSA